MTTPCRWNINITAPNPKYRMKKDIFNCGHVETKYKKTLTAALVSEIVEPQKLLGEN